MTSPNKPPHDDSDLFDWVDDLRAATLQTIALVVCAAALGTALFLIFK